MQNILLSLDQLSQLTILSVQAEGSIALETKDWFHETLEALSAFLEQHSVF